MSERQMPTDAELLAALARRLHERREALQQSAEVLREMHAVNERLGAAEQLKGRFLSNIRNEINNPLTTLRGFAEMIAKNPDLPRERVSQMAAVMLREVSDLSFQMQNIFAAADLEAGSAVPELRRVDVGAMLTEIAGEFRGEAGERAIELQVSPPVGLAGVTDPTRLALVVANLLRNAIAFAASRVEIAARTDGARLFIEVRDDGPGIRLVDAERIFDRFEQLSVGSAKQHPGHGLGLAVARACTELLAGSLVLDPSPAPGACFRVEVPLPPGDESSAETAGADPFLFAVVETF